jgi:hypothetical protein
MKHVLLIIVAVILSINATAQNADSLDTKVENTDSINARIEKLQHDFNFLSCQYELNKIVTDLSVKSCEVNNNSNGILLNCYHGRFDRDLYDAYKDYYYSQKNWYNSLKENITSTTTLVTLKMIASNFSEMEINSIKSTIDVITNAQNSFEQALYYYNTVLGIYLDL